MKKLYYLLFLLPALALSQTQNYIKTTSYKVPTLNGVSATDGTVVTTDKKIVNVMYFDGLGRQIQHVAHLQSGTGNNVITPIVYDASGAPTKQYMPFPSESTTIGYTDNVSVLSSLQSYYMDTMGFGTDGANPYIETKLEASPLRRALKQAAPGADWIMPVNTGDPDHTVRFDYMINTATEVRRLTTTSSMSSGLYNIAPITTSGYYAAGELVKTTVKDENNAGGNDHSVVEFRNKEGQVILKRTYESGQEHDTYYVYDQYGNLTYVVPPMADSANVTNAMLNGYCYQYKYDNRNRLVEKKLPGKDWEFIVYDKLNRIAATGPANSPFSDLSSQGWMIVKYDVFNRPVITGWMPSASITSQGRKSLQQEADSHATMYTSETKIQNAGNISVNDIALRYDNYSWPASSTSYHILTVRYYDDYNFPDAPTSFSVMIDLQEKAYYNNTDKKPKGLLTGSFVRVLSTTSSTEAEKSYTLYDEYGRPVRQFTGNHLGGHIQRDNKLDFEGKPIHIVTKHKRDAGATEISLKDAFGFTGQNRLLVHTHQIGAGTPQLMSRNAYNGLGQLISKFVGGTNLLGSNALQKIDYSYTIRGWLKEVNKMDAMGTDLFAYALNYNTVTNETTGIVNKKVKKLYNGNVSEMIWKSAGDSKKRRYGYRYDSMNRLTDAIYQNADMDTPQAPYAGVTNAYNEHVGYDKNGNIIFLQRNGNVDVADPLQAVAIDDLNYVYEDSSNKLVKVEDLENHPAGFKDGTNTGNDYDHDGYGNIEYDLNKGISSITYNHLNLPKVVTFSTGNKIEYTYNAVGTRVGKKVTNGASVTQTHYLNGFQYKGTDLEFFPTAEGYVDATAGAYKYVFNFRDHLGNVRLSYTKDGTNPVKVLEENHYYPFGMEHEGYNTLVYDYRPNTGGSGSSVLSLLRNKSQYKFNGQEYQDELGLNVTAMDYRQYDNALGRFHSMDALAELAPGMTPYRFGFNNPVCWSDPTGLFESEAAAQAHLERYGITGATISYNQARGYWEIQNNGYTYWQSSIGDLWLQYSSSGGVNFINLEGSGGGFGAPGGGFGAPGGGFGGFSSGSFGGSSGASYGGGSGGGGSNSNGLLDWDGPIGRRFIPDFINAGVGFSGIFGFGAGSSVELNWVMHGPDASWKPIVTVTQVIGVGYSVDATFNVGTVRYSGNASEITSEMLVTNTLAGDKPTIWVSGALSDGINVGGTGTFTPLASGNFLYGGQVNFGAGLPLGPVPINGAVGVSNTWIIHEF